MSLPLHPNHLEAIAAVLLFGLSYATYHFDLLSPLFIKPFFRKVPGEKRQAYTLFLHRFSGVFILGLIPLTILIILFDRVPAEYGLRLPAEPWWYLVGLAIGLLAIVALSTWARQPASAEIRPLARLDEWQRSDRVWNILSWITYLGAYESALRGYLLYALMRSIGIWPAILLMTVFYVIVHLDKEKEEVIGSALLGPLFGVITLASGSIFVPWLIHTCIAAGSDTMVVRFHHRPVSALRREAGS